MAGIVAEGTVAADIVAGTDTVTPDTVVGKAIACTAAVRGKAPYRREDTASDHNPNRSRASASIPPPGLEGALCSHWRLQVTGPVASRPAFPCRAALPPGMANSVQVLHGSVSPLCRSDLRSRGSQSRG